MEKELKYVSPDYHMRLDVLADMICTPPPKLAEVAIIGATRPALRLVDAPKDDAGWE